MRDRDATMRLLSPEQEAEVRAAFDRGVRAVVLASQYGVTRRTIYRTIHRTDRDIFRVKVGGYHATYEIGAEGPIQLTPWRAA